MSFGLQLSIHASNDNENDVMFPSAFLSPQSLPSHNTMLDDDDDDDLFIYCTDKHATVADYQPISPPAEYAEFSSSPSYPTPRKESR